MTKIQYPIPVLILDLAPKTSTRDNSQSPSEHRILLEIPTLLNVLPYLDIGHGKCLDWAPHRTVTAELPGIYDGAKTPSKFWCFATSVANRNACLRPREEQALVRIPSAAIQANGVPRRHELRRGVGAARVLG
ncbi:hypothetical protein F4825DRAFT_473920 [Nemania diffusa]|nr:hypothetical protein F4825DRAFT_473920 [Nemania diffusa]